MARLPGYENTRSVETGSQFVRARSTRDATSAALSGVGKSLAGIGASLQAVDDKLNAKLEAEAERTAALEVESDVIRTTTDERVRWQREQQNAPESGAGVYDGFMREHDRVWQDRLAAMPPERRPAAEVKFMRARESMATEVAGFERARRQQFLGTVAKEKDASLTSGIKAGTMDHATATAEVNGFVDGLRLPPNLSTDLKRRMGMSVDAARIEREIATNAPGALRDLTRQVGAAPTSSNPHIQRLSEAAARHGVPAVVMLAAVKGESNFDPTVDMSKKINPKTGKPYSSAFGYGQMINSNWAEVGMAKSDDPEVQAEAVARIFKKRIDHLQRNGVEATPANVWGAHFVGPGTYTALLRADPNTPLRDVMLPRYGAKNYIAATTGNGSLLKDGATVGQTLAAIRAYSDKNVAAVSGGLKSGAPAPAGTPVTIGDTQLQYMTSDDLPRYLARAQEAARRQSDAAMTEAAKATVASGPLSAFNPAHRADADKAFKADGVGSAILQGDPEAVGRAAAFTRQNLWMPQDASASAQTLMSSPDPAQKVQGYELGLTAHAADPVNGLQHSRFDADMQKRVRLYATIREEDGIDPREAVRRTEAILSPENQKRASTEEFTKSVKERKERLTFSDLSTEADMKGGTLIGRMLGFGYDRTPASDKVRDFMTDQYRDSFERHAAMFGNVDAAVTAAKRDMKRVIGVTKVFGVEQATLLPVERMLPALPDGTHSYVRDQALFLLEKDAARAKESHKRLGDVEYGPLDPKNIVLKPTAQTWLDYRAGRAPAYDLLYIDKKNSMVREVQLGFRPDYSAGHEAYLRASSGEAATTEPQQPARAPPRATPTAPDAAGKRAERRERAAAEERRTEPRTGAARRSSMPASILRGADN